MVNASRNIETAVVYCASRFGHDERFKASAQETGALLAAMGIHLKYGGGNNGLMGAVAQAAVENSGKVSGIAPEVFRGAAQSTPDGAFLMFTEDMMTRKRALIEGSDIVITLGGGIGTLDEFFETAMVNYLDLNNNPEARIKPIVFFDPTGLSNKLIEYVQATVDAGLTDASVMQTIFSVKYVKELEELILQWQDNFPQVALDKIPEMRASNGAPPGP